MSQNPASANKTILIILALAVAALSYYIFVADKHDPVTLPEESQEAFLEDDDNAKMWEENSSDLLENNTVDLEGLEQTALDLTLMGVVASNVDEEASATIQSRLQVRTYFIGDQIAYTNAELIEVRNDRVILLDAGEKRVLLLQGTKTSNSNTTMSAKTSDDTDSAGQEAEELARLIGNRPKLLEHIVSTQPVNLSGIEGLLVSPGQNPKLFRAARFQEGDVLQSVNGHDVSTEEGLQAIQDLLPNAQTLIFSVLRGGRVINLYLDIPSEGLKLQTN